MAKKFYRDNHQIKNILAEAKLLIRTQIFLTKTLLKKKIKISNVFETKLKVYIRIVPAIF